ncbi:MAG TPA: aminotransferase class V-fold PLP-dependent enzyme [Bryobacteraceae bacterium]|nr:aminotransferase class V-fold PLP-dependent enzyme [Bryobacteraceae bacterium]
MNRRNLLNLAAGTAAAQTLARVIAAAQERHASETAADEDFWAAVRNEFTIDRLVVNLNNGHVSPSPRTVQEAMRRYLDYSNMGPYHTMIRQLEPKVEMARRMIAEAAGCDPEEIAITRNSSEALEIAQLGVKLDHGDEVLTTNQDYPRMLTTFEQRARRDGIRVKQISFPVPAISLDDLYQRFEQAISPATKLILVCHITNRTGQIFPIRRICDMAHARRIRVVVDGAHAFSHFPFRISDLGCDYYGVSLHKWTFAPVGTGFLYVRKPLIRETWALMASSQRQDDDIRKFEEIGTHPSANFAAICEAIAFNQNIGIERKAARLRYLRDRWANALGSNPKIRILHNPAQEMSCGIGMLGLRDGDLAALGRSLEAKHGVFTAVVAHSEYTGMRITPSVYTTIRDIDYFVRAVEEELKHA